VRGPGVGAAPHFSTPGAKRPTFSRFGAHLYPVHFSRFDPKVPHFSVYYPRVYRKQPGQIPPSPYY
jgi:hypothetical protein